MSRKIDRVVICPHCSFAVPIAGQGAQTIAKVIEPKVAKPKSTAPSLKDILGDHFDAYWKVAKIFGEGKNYTPRDSALAYMTHIVGGATDLAIYTAASRLRIRTEDPRYLPQLKKWLEGSDFTAMVPVSDSPENPESRLSGRKMAE